MGGLALLLMWLSQPHPGAAAVLVDEFHAGRLEHAPNGQNVGIRE